MTVAADPVPHLLAGVTIPLVTTLDEHARPDAPAARPLLEHLARGGVTTLMLTGTNGEGPLLPDDHLRAYADDISVLWREIAGASARIMVTASGAGTREMLRRMEVFDGLDIDAVVVSAPTYFRHTEQELETHFRAAAAHGRPVVIYNAPVYTGNPLTAALARRLLDTPAIIGMKDSSGDPGLLGEFCALAAGRPDFAVSQGAERYLAEGVRRGAIGLVPGVGMLAPGLCTELLRLGRQGHHETADQRQRDVVRLTALFGVRPGASGVVVMKTALHLLGLCPPHVAAPFLPCTATELAALRKELDGLRDVLPALQHS